MTNREKIITNLLAARTQFETEKYKKVREIWMIEPKIEEINQKLKNYGRDEIYSAVLREQPEIRENM